MPFKYVPPANLLEFLNNLLIRRKGIYPESIYISYTIIGTSSGTIEFEKETTEALSEILEEYDLNIIRKPYIYITKKVLII